MPFENLVAQEILRKHDRFIRFKNRLIARGFSELESELESASWVYLNAILDVSERSTSKCTEDKSTLSIFDEQVAFGRLHPQFKNYIATLMGVHSTCQALILQGRVAGPLEAYDHIFDGEGISLQVKCSWCANELQLRRKQREQHT